MRIVERWNAGELLMFTCQYQEFQTSARAVFKEGALAVFLGYLPESFEWYTVLTCVGPIEVFNPRHLRRV